ncbi:TIGR02301 family protein [Methylopila sp. 73B]|uniref:TIGR02301 family protein n=1 Tax=Methylopila sp. 73B TaxID=1120792 RepID=UPI000363E83F|nr:TIGR02301 family protein [Methylopila sp. 73B]
MSTVLRAALAGLLLATAPAAAQPREPKAAPAPPPPAPQLPAAAAPYEPKLIRLAETLGALHHLRAVCKAKDADVWRDRMSALIAAEAPAPERRDALAGAFNASYRAWARSYHACTPAAEVATARFLQEVSAIATEVNARYGP